MSAILVFILSLCAATVLTARVIRYAHRRELLDIPNARSSHATPTPRGGGLAVVVVVLITAMALWLGGILGNGTGLALLGGGGLMALTGWIDDHRDLPALYRLLLQFLAAGWLLAWLPGHGVVEIAGYTLGLGGLVLPALVVIACVWLINLYNFMDGADGFAGLQCLSACLAVALMLVMDGYRGGALLPTALAGACAGFMVWNWPPARIFMGDVGSYFVGYCLALLALLTNGVQFIDLSIWGILLSVFLWDASLTLVMRIFAGQTWYKAHRSHAYQNLIQMGWTHRRLALGFAILQLGLLWPLAFYVHARPQAQGPVLLGISLLMVLIWGTIQYRFRQGTAHP